MPDLPPGLIRPLYIRRDSLDTKEGTKHAIGTPLLLSEKEKQSCLLARTSVTESCAPDYQECLLQEIIDRWPNILPINDFYPNVTSLCSLGCEIPVDIGNTEGRIDNLLLTNDGHLVIVETKLWRNPESLRAVIAQTLQYGMAVSQLNLDELEDRLRRGDHKGCRFSPDETVLQRACNLLPGRADDFEDAFDRIRLAGEILLLIVSDGIRASAERLVQWMNTAVGSAPYKFGLVELCLYNMPDASRLVVSKTLLRIREASRHVVSINLQGPIREHITATVSAPNEPPSVRRIPPPGLPLTEEGLTRQIMAKTSPEITALADQLRTQLAASGLKKRALPATIQYGLDVAGDFVPLVSLNATNVWFGIPMRVVRDLGGERFVACKQKINSVAQFYRSEDISDPEKANALGPKYVVLQDKVEAFVDAVLKIAETIRNAVTEAS